MNQQHLEHDVRLFTKGGLPDANQEFLGASSEGVYYDATNFRISENGEDGALQKIGGATVAEQCLDNGYGGGGGNISDTYRCMLAESINNNYVAIWASTGDVTLYPPIITVNGNTCLKSTSFPITTSNPIQWDKNENCVGGELYITDYNSPPMFFNIQDLIDNQLTSKYFTAFNVKLYQIALTSPLDHPIFVGHYSAGSGGGLPEGEYLYAIQYVSDGGDQTNTSVYTPPIAIPKLSSAGSTQYPYSKTYGGNDGNTINTKYGITIKFRVNNYLNYQYIQIVRKTYNNQIALGALPTTQIIKKIPIVDGEISIRTFDDIPSNEDAPITVNDDDASSLTANFARAKAVRYFNQRLYFMNIEYNSSDIEDSVTFKQSANGKYLYPYIEKMSEGGHGDPYNLTYKRNYQSGERYGFSVVGFDGFGNSTFAKAVTTGTNFQFPNRRDKVSDYPDTVKLSNNTTYGGIGTGTVRAATVDGTIEATFERFDTADSIRKSDSASSISVAQQDNGGVAQPLTPTSPSDTDVLGHNQIINTGVDTLAGGGTHYNSEEIGNCFGLNYFSQGIAIEGIETYPDTIKAFSVLRTKPANRVVCQGLGVYAINPDATNTISNSKQLSQLRFYAPDLDNGICQDDFLTNYSDYQLQAVSPLGFFTELYAGTNDGRHLDFINYARVIRDNGSINAGDLIGFSGIIDGGSGYWCTGYGAWRVNTPQGAGDVFENFGNGNNVFYFSSPAIDAVINNDSRQTNLYDLSLSVPIYKYPQIASNEEANFNASSTRQFHEPYYVCNIIQDGRQVADQNIDQYIETGHYQKVSSLIGLSDGANNQHLGYELVDERFDDCCPNDLDASVLSGDSTYSKGHVYVYVDDGGLSLKAWLNVHYLDAAYVANLKLLVDANGSTVDNNGVTIYGFCSNGKSTDGRTYTINFGVHKSVSGIYIPETGTKIYVNYDNRFPFKVFGGDTTIGESIFAPLDNKTDSDGAYENNNLFEWRLPFPYPKYDINENIRILENGSTGDMQTDNTGIKFVPSSVDMSRIRQWTVMWTAETRSNLPYSYATNSEAELVSDQSQFYPNMNYVYRSYEWNADDPYDGFSDNYSVIYPNESAVFGYGGFRFKPQNNIDYSHDTNNRVYVSKPAIGFTEQTQFCSRIIYSLIRPINVQDSPNVRTFPPLNYFDIEDSQGEIKFAWDALSSKNNNLYAFTDKGVCLLITDQRILSEVGGDQLALIGSSSTDVILGQYWLSKNIGMWGEMWRTASEYNNMIFWANNEGEFKLIDNNIINLSDGKFVSIILPVLSQIPNDYTLTIAGAYDVQHGEYWNQIHFPIIESISKTYVYDDGKNCYLGKYTYFYDKYLYYANNMYGFKNGVMYVLNDGYSLDGENITAKVRLVTGKDQILSKEFVRMRIASTSQPTEIRGYDNVTDLNPIWTINDTKNYGAYESYIPRKSAAPNNRVQGRSTVIEIEHSEAEDCVIIDADIQYKKLK